MEYMVKEVKDLEPGDVVMGTEGPKQVKRLQYQRNNYNVKITFMDGSKVTLRESYKLQVEKR